MTIFILGAADMLAQNLVNNGDFEATNGLPSVLSQTGLGQQELDNHCTFWSTPLAMTSPDYFHRDVACTTSSCPDVPTNTWGFENALSGKAYAGILTTDLTPQGNSPFSFREYIKGNFSAPLEPCATYQVEFYTSLASETTSLELKLGAVITDVDVYQPTGQTLALTPQIEASSTLKVWNTWEKVSGTYTAVGGEEYIIIGFFPANPQFGTDYTYQVPGVPGDLSAYYYIDDVSVTKIADPNCGDGYYDVSFDKVETPGEECCFDLSIETLPGACDLFGVRIWMPGASGPSFISGANGNWSISDPADPDMLAWFPPAPMQAGATAQVGTFCVTSSTATRTVRIDYLGVNGQITCSVERELEANCTIATCCDERFFDLTFTGDPDAGAEECCWTFDLGLAEGACDVHGIEFYDQGNLVYSIPNFPDGPLYGGQKRTQIGDFCLPKFHGTHDIEVRFLTQNGFAMCTTTATLQCLCRCQGSFNLEGRVERLLLNENTEFAECCWDLYVKNLSDCDIRSIGIITKYGGHIDNTEITSIESSDWNGEYLSGYDTGDNSTVWWRNGFTKHVIPAGGEIYLGRICVDFQTPPKNLSFQVVTYIDENDPSGGYAFCEFATPPLDCNTEDCCDDIEPVLTSFPSTNPELGCCYNILTDLPECATNIVSMLVTPQAPTTIIDYIAPSPVESSSLTFTRSGQSISGDFCLNPHGSGANQTLNVQYLDAQGQIICEKEVELTCVDLPQDPCCDDFGLIFMIDPLAPGVRCCVDIHITQNQPSPCHLGGVDIIGPGTSGGIPWTQNTILPPTGSPGLKVGSFCVDPGNEWTATIVFRGTDGSILCTKEWTINCPGVSTVSKQGGTRTMHPLEIEDSQVLHIAPIPATDYVTMSYSVERDADVVLQVYDMLGSRVALVERRFRKSGRYTTSFDASRLTPGLYYVKMEFDGVKHMTPMLITR